MSIESPGTDVPASCTLYQGARVKESTLGEYCTVGNFSRVDFSTLDEAVRIDRNNHIFRSELGRHTYTGMGTVIMGAEVGHFCSISWNVSIGGANHDFRRTTQHAFLYNDYDGIRPDDAEIPYDRFSEAVSIGNDVWMASGAVVTRGVTVGNGAVVGANAVVTRDVPPYAIVVGAPAKVIKFRFEDEIIEALETLQWWRWPKTMLSEHFDTLAHPPSARALRELASIIAE